MSNHERLAAMAFMESITPEVVHKRFDRGVDFFPGFHAEDNNSPIQGQGAGWTFHVPSCFCNALDIKQTPKLTEEEKRLNKSLPKGQKIKPKLYWTQGSEFSFTEGCIVYDTPIARTSGINWGATLQALGRAMQVVSGYAASPARVETETWKEEPEDLMSRINEWESKGVEIRTEDNTHRKTPEFKLMAFVPRVPGQINLIILRPNTTKSKLEETERLSMTQDQFVKTLIIGLTDL